MPKRRFGRLETRCGFAAVTLFLLSATGLPTLPKTVAGPAQRAAPSLPPAISAAVAQLPTLAPEDALARNAAIPISSLVNPAAHPFLLLTPDIETKQRALDCMTAAVFYEAASESDEGQAAVAQVVVNRVRDPAYPKSVCGVVFQQSALGGCQFSFTCDESMTRIPNPAGWARARRAAQAALTGKVETTIGLSTHYHTIWVAPDWSATLVKTAVIGAHIFYRALGHDGGSRYGGGEPAVAALASLSPAHAGAAAPSPAPALEAIVPEQTAMIAAPVAGPHLPTSTIRPEYAKMSVDLAGL